MLLTGSHLQQLPVMSLQTGAEIARLARPVIDPADLRIYGYEVTGPLLDQRPSFLRLEDIRELSNMGMIVDSSDEFIAHGDVLIFDKVVALGFRLLGQHVSDQQGRRVGKVIDYTIDSAIFTIQQLTVKRPLYKSFNDVELLIHRDHIVEINDHGIIINSDTEPRETSVVELGGAYINPFRSKTPAPEHIDQQ